MAPIAPDDFAELLGLAPAALMLLDASGQVIYRNPAAERMLARTTMLRIAGGTLAARRKGEDKGFRDALAGLTAEQPAALVCLRNREEVPVMVIDLQRLRSGLVALRMADMAQRPAPSPARLRTLFGLTPAEARVAVAMLSGMGIQAVAREHGVEAETVRTQAKRIRGKTGSRTQSQLLSVLAAAAADFVTEGH